MNLVFSPWGVRWSSLATAALIVIVVTVIKRRPFYAFTATMAWGVAFEIVYEATNVLVHDRGAPHLGPWAWWLVTVAAWPFLAYVLGVRPHLLWVGISALIFALWIQQGFWFNWAGQGARPINWWFEALNVGSKTALAVAYLLGALAPERSGWLEVLVRGRRAGRVRPQPLDRSGELVG